MEVAGLSLLVALAALPIILSTAQRPGQRLLLVGLSLALGATLGLAASSTRAPAHDEASVVDRPIEQPTGGFAGSDTCRPCHAREHATWRASYHSRMTQLADELSVLGDFDDVVLEGGGRKAVLSRDERGHWVQLDGLPERHPIVMTTGSHHMQAYWYPAGSGRELGQLPFIWLRTDGRWAPRNAVFLRPPGEAADETRRWNLTCNKCHSTHARPGVRDLDDIDTRVSEFGIACEACHGPGAEHVRANRDPLRRYELQRQGKGDETIVNPARLDHVRASHVCAQCHALFQFVDAEEFEAWKDEGYRYRPGESLTDTRFFVHPGQDHPALIAHLEEDPTYFERKFWADGMIRMAGREHIGLLSTPCFTDGDMSCLSCHRLHRSDEDPRGLEEWADDQLGVGMRGSEACLQCHEELREEEALVAHTHHEADSPGSDCYECHMPRVAYGLAKAIRTHHLESPSVAIQLATGRPLACNQCHLDQTLAWSAEHLALWHGQPMPPLTADQREIAASILWAVRGDATQRALTAWTMGWDVAQEVSGTDWLAPYLVQLLADPYEVVRLMAHRSLRTLPGFEDFQFDFVAPSEERIEAGWFALRHWAQLQAADPDRSTGRRLLLSESGDVLSPTVQRLLDERDHRLIELDE